MRFFDIHGNTSFKKSIAIFVGIVPITLLSGCGGGGGSATPAGVSAHYAIRDLGTFLPHKITNNSKILGYLSSSLPYRPAIWQDGVPTPFDTQGGTANDLSIGGVVAGSVDKNTKIQAATFTNGIAQIISLPDNGISRAYSVNASNDVAGVFSTTSTISGPIYNLLTDHAFLSTHGRPIELAPLAGHTSADATAINDLGVVAGYTSLGSAPSSDIVQRAVIWNRGKAKDLNVFGGSRNSQAVAINNNGTVAGLADTYPGSLNYGAHISFLWKSGISTELRSLTADQVATVKGINTAGVCVGVSGQSLDMHAVAWSGEDAVDLQTRIPGNAGWSLQSAASINDAGEIVGVGIHNGVQSGFLLTPQ